LAATFYFLGDFESSQQHAMRGAQIWRSKGILSPVEEPIAPAVTCRCHPALAEWHLGETASCQATMDEAITLAKELNDMHALAQALWNEAVLAHYERPAELFRFAPDPSRRRSARLPFVNEWAIDGAPWGKKTGPIMKHQSLFENISILVGTVAILIITPLTGHAEVSFLGVAPSVASGLARSPVFTRDDFKRGSGHPSVIIPTLLPGL
jgi:hypothetical protein